MQKRAIALFMLILVLSVFSVYAAGTSTGARGSDNSVSPRVAVDSVSPREAIKQAILEKKEEIRQQYRDRSCESVESRRERIKCRLVQEENANPAGTVEEACRLNDEKRGRCVALYSVLKKCYDLQGIEKDKCFKRAIGLRAKFSDVPAEERAQKSRDYVVALLYDLQEKIEEKNEEGDIDPEAAAQLVDKIVEIKQDILNGAEKEIIKGKMREFRTMWQNTMNEVEDE